MTSDVSTGRPGARYRGAVVPYITAWSEERALPVRIIERPLLGIGYTDESFVDRDEHGVLWRRVLSRPGAGRPLFGEIHTPRQRRAMQRLLCQVCSGPADQNEAGTLWLLKDHRGDWPGWPNGMGVTEPPVCLPCARTAINLCPSLRRGHVALRVAHHPIAGVQGLRYQVRLQRLQLAESDLVPLEDPAIRWTQAVHLIREITGCVFVDL
ncbi:MAG TPA: hypothetical protein VGR06_22805 [Actinophytocola sp.]|uniref:hypothetical protein n=1 Tax=Actinophytocola sp. TaxID=1872138 RepID=UPI002DF9C5F6|nr:hypothetical protein [Actinophytocola sp.]